MKYTFLASIVIISVSVGCKQDLPSDRCISEPLVNVSLGLQNDTLSRSSDSATLAIASLNNSDISGVLKIISKANIDTFTYNQYKGIKPVSDRNNTVNYLVFRYLDYINDLNKSTLIPILVSRRPYSPRDQCMEDIVHRCESYYLFYFTYTSQKERRACIDSLELMLQHYPAALRIKYLLADLRFTEKQFDEAVPIFRELVKGKYYGYNSLRKITEYYWRYSRKDSFNSCVRQIQGLYPKYCIPELIDSFAATKNISGATSEFSRCLSNGNQKDSIKATVYLCRCYLNACNFDKVDSFYAQFDKTNGYILDTLRIWATGEFYDMKLRNLFIQKRYKKFLAFAMQNVGANEKIGVDNSNEFYKLVRQYFIEYFPGRSESEFEMFFRKEFYAYDEGRKST
jgi:hypothetical protein